VLLLALCVLAEACGGAVAAPAGGADGGGAGGSGAGGTGGGLGTGGCPALPAAPVYDCKSRAPLADDCPPWQGKPGGTVGYPQGCNVTIPQKDGFSGCGPQVCSCSVFPGMAGGTWVCPL
jgi:hypothetical protein